MTGGNSKGDDETLMAAFNAIRSDDATIQNEGVAAAIQADGLAVPGLLSLLKEPGVSRAQVMYALAQIGDSRAEQAFLTGLGDGDEGVRAYAAEGLVRIGHADSMSACLQTLNDAPDPLHLDLTPSVAALGEMGLKAMPFLLDLLLDEDETTRLHSQRALESILNRRHGFRPGQGFLSPAAADKMHGLWQDNGDYDYAADAQRRAESVAKWRRWLLEAKE